MGQEIGEVGEGMGILSPGGAILEHLEACPDLRDHPPKKFKLPQILIFVGLLTHYMMSFSSEDPIKEEPKPWVEERTVPSGTVRVIPH